MRRSHVAAVVIAVGLVGCPLPQPLPNYPAGTVTPPRILADAIQGNAEVVRFVPAACAIEPKVELTATINDTNTLETVEARWFVNYDRRDQSYYQIYQRDPIPPNADTLNLIRIVPPNDAQGNPKPFTWGVYHMPPPYDGTAQSGTLWNAAGIVRVVELVVSNGFDPSAVGNADSDLPNRATTTSGTEKFETQVYRWVFVTVPENVDASGACPPAPAVCVKCPAAP